MVFIQTDSISSSSSSSWKYYQIRTRLGHDILSIRTITSVGSVDVFVKRCLLSSAFRCAQSQLPNTTFFDYSTAGRDRDDWLTIHRADQTDAIYVVGVTSQSVYSAYQISTTTNQSTLALQAGVTVRDFVEPGKADHFSFYLNQYDERIRISLTSVSQETIIFDTLNL